PNALRPRRRLRLLALGDFPPAEPRDGLDQLHGDRLGEREADCPLADLVPCKVLLEPHDEAIAGRINRVVLPPPGEIDYGSTVQLVRGDLVRDHFLGSRESFADGPPHALEHAPCGLGLRSNVLVHRFEAWHSGAMPSDLETAAWPAGAGFPSTATPGSRAARRRHTTPCAS